MVKSSMECTKCYLRENVISRAERGVSKVHFIQLVILLFWFLIACTVAANPLPRCDSSGGSVNGPCLGKIVWDGFAVFEGLIENGEAVKGTVKYDNGEYYDGELLRTRPHGRGKFTNLNGSIYEGEIKYGLYYGQGNFIFAQDDEDWAGHSYEGEFKSGVYHGKGTYFYPDGAKFVGDYVDGKATGKGAYFYTGGGATLVGDYVDGVANGKGTYSYANGSTYFGDYVDGMATGFGKFTEGPNSDFAGEWYEGEFVEALFHGYGKYTHLDGTFIKGFYENNRSVQVILHLCTLESLQECTDGDICSAATRPESKTSKKIVWDELLGANYKLEAESRDLNCTSASNVEAKLPQATPKIVAEKANTSSKMALVIGNASYKNQPTLANPIADAHLISRTLESLGFQVTTSLDLNRKEMIQEIIKYKNSLSSATVSLIYFAGHGIEIMGENYLMPIDSEGSELDLIKYEAIPLSDLISITQLATKLSIILVDSCRNNPFLNKISGGNRSMLRGLKIVDIPQKGPANQIISFATSSGKFAEDGQTSNSPYAKVLVNLLTTPDLEVGKLFRMLGDEVFKNTNGRQRPVTRNRLGASDIFLGTL